MQKMSENQKLRKLTMAAVALLLVVCLGAGVFLQFGEGLFSAGQAEITGNFETEEPLLTEKSTVTKEDGDELLARPQGGKQMYEILEIVPDEHYTVFRYLIGGMEPNKNILLTMSNMGGFENVVGRSETAQTPFTVIEDGIKKEYLDSYNNTVGNKQNDQYEIKRFKVSDTGNTDSSFQNPGYFQYVGKDKGLYELDEDSTKTEYLPCAGGGYLANFNKEDLYNKSAAAKLTLEANKTNTTGYNYDAVLEYDTQGKTGYFVSSTVADAQGPYVIDHEATRVLLGFSSGTVSGGSTDNYASELQTLWVRKDYSKIVFRAYDSSKDTGAEVSRYKLYFDYEVDNSAVEGARYVISEYTFNPGKGEFFAKCKRDDATLMYYTEAGESETGEYEIYITDFKMTACVGESGATKGDWVWRQGASADGKVYSTIADWDNGKGVLWTPSFVCDANGNKSYYCKNTYRNNEWFKLLCLGIPDYEYDMNKSPGVNLVEADTAIKAFDKSTRINIITVTPDKVTQDMIDKADLIYVSNQYAFNNLSNALSNAGISTGTQFTTDLGQFSMTRSIFKYCMTKKKAVMMNVAIGALSTGDSLNLVKLYQMFTMYKNPHNMEYFLEDMKGLRDGFNYIDINGNVVVRSGYYGGKNKYFDLASENAFNSSLAGLSETDIADKKKTRYQYRDTYASSSIFNTTYFEVRQGDDQSVTGYEMGWDTNTWVNAVANGERYLIFHWYGQGFLQTITNMPKINQILKQDTFGVYVTNSVMNSSWEDVIYVDEFDEQYKIYYMIEATKVLYDVPTVEKVEVYIDADGDGVIDEGLAPFLEIRASGSIAANPAAGESKVDANGTALNHNKDVRFYPGYAIDVKAQMAGAQEKCFIIKVIGKKDIGESAPVEVVETTAVSVIVRDMFELN